MQSSREVTANLAILVEDKKKELMARNSALSALEAHRLAMDAVVNKNHDVVKLYRADAGR
jgi:hypothetical protein